MKKRFITIRNIGLMLLVVSVCGCAYTSSTDQYRVYLRRAYLLLQGSRGDPANASRQLDEFMNENARKIKLLKNELEALGPAEAMRAYRELSEAFSELDDLTSRSKGLIRDEAIKRNVRELMP